jgi:hypothetical protein
MGDESGKISAAIPNRPLSQLYESRTLFQCSPVPQRGNFQRERGGCILFVQQVAWRGQGFNRHRVTSATTRVECGIAEDGGDAKAQEIDSIH